MIYLIDSHCHLDFTVFDPDRDQLIQQCQHLGIETIIVPGVTAARWRKLEQLKHDFSALEVALGLHPLFMDEHLPQHIEQLDSQIQQQRPIAVGEIGLDFYNGKDNAEQQIGLFTEQLKLAEKYQLPVILHVRKAHDDVLKILRQFKLKGGIAHAFNGSMQQAESYMKMGFLFGVGGALTYPRATKLQSLYQTLPLQHIVLETDAPDMPLHGQQGQRNSPLSIPSIQQQLAAIRNTSPELVAEQTTRNCQQLFGLAASAAS
jgi:TatD DNase family protein